jgi:2-methylisocitrate lyase-like PEP mutase family enzyme
MSLRARLARPGILVAPGVYDPLSALLATRAGFEALYVSGGSIAYTRFGRPDIGLVGMDEVAETVGLIRERVKTPLIVDADTGYGNALNVQRTVRRFARDGADAIQIEDQTFPKRCGHLDEKRVVPTGEMVGKIKAALDARPSAETLIVARTDAVGVEGLESALDRAESYREAGADVLFIEALRSDAEIEAAMRRFRGRVPLLANMVEGGKTPVKPAAALESLGFSVAIFPGGLARARVKMELDYFASLKAHGTTEPFRDRMLDFQGLNAVLGTADMLAAGRKYEG